MANRKCIHVVAIDGYEPEMLKVTLPTIKAYADKIGADFNLITKPKFGGYPPNYERLQIWEAGKNYDWNFNIDADFVIHPDCEDPTAYHDSAVVGALMGFRNDTAFIPNLYFVRDGRNQGVSDNYTLTSSLTHDFWIPSELSFEELKLQCHPHQTRRVSELVVSTNLARFGLKFGGIIADRTKIYHINKTTDSIEKPEDVARSVLEKWAKGESVSKYGGAYDYKQSSD